LKLSSNAWGDPASCSETEGSLLRNTRLSICIWCYDLCDKLVAYQHHPKSWSEKNNRIDWNRNFIDTLSKKTKFSDIF